MVDGDIEVGVKMAGDEVVVTFVALINGVKYVGVADVKDVLGACWVDCVMAFDEEDKGGVFGNVEVMFGLV